MDNRLIDILKSLDVVKSVKSGAIKNHKEWQGLLDEIIDNINTLN